MTWTVAPDFDGVLHAYDGEWQGPTFIPGEPVPGAIEWLNELAGEYKVAICSTRCNTVGGRDAIEAWLRESGLSAKAQLSVRAVAGKPAALIYVDDRAWRFTGENFPSVDQIRRALPWWKA